MEKKLENTEGARLTEKVIGRRVIGIVLLQIQDYTHMVAMGLYLGVLGLSKIL